MSIGAKGYDTNTISIINNFILDTYASGFSILQELVQNANDAESTCLILSLLSNGIKDACHPMLKNNPLFIVVNDGSFNDENEIAISKLGEGSKGRNNSTIGKFGLGMKSLFHLTDLIFYLTTDEKYGSIINPYISPKTERDEVHPTWNYDNESDYKNDFNLLREEVFKIYSGHKTAFCLFLPLRQNDGNSHIRQTYFSKERSLVELFSSELNSNKTIVNSFDNQLSIMAATLSVTSKNNKLKTIKFVSDKDKINCELRDKSIYITDDEKNFKTDFDVLRFSEINNGDDKDLFDKKIKKYSDIIHESYSWPRNSLLEENTRVHDKMVHDDSSIIILKQNKDNHDGSLNIMWASYLPLKKDDQIIKLRLPDSAFSYTIVFNAAFAIDSGRNGIIKYFSLFERDFPHDENELYERVSKIDSQDEIMGLWNKFLFQEVLAPAVPELLMKAKDVYPKIQDNDFSIIIGALASKSDIKKCIVSNKGINYVLRDSKLKWRLEKSKDYVFLPNPQKLVDNQIYQSLESEICYENAIRYRDCKYLLNDAKDTTNDALRNSCFALIIEQDKYLQLFEKEDFLSWFITLVRSIDFDESEATQYFSIIKKVLLYLSKFDDFKVTNKLHDFIKNLIIQIEKTGYACFANKIAIDLSKIRELWQVDGRIILLPHNMESISSNYNDIDISDYLKNTYIPLVNKIGLEYAGELYKSCITDFSELNSFSYEIFNGLPSNYSIIPAIKRDLQSLENAKNSKSWYLSKDDLNKYVFAASSLFDYQKYKVFFEFAPEVTACYEINKDDANRFKITNLKQISLSGLVEEILPKYVGKYNTNKAEELIKRVVENDSSWYEKIKMYEVFPTTICGKCTLLTQDCYIDIDNYFSDSFIPEKDYSIIHLKDEDLRGVISNRLDYLKYFINENNVLSVYLKMVDHIDYNTIKGFLSKTNKVEVDKESREKLRNYKWYVYNGRTYSCSQILVVKKEKDEFHNYLEEKGCLVVSEEDLKGNNLLSLLREKSVLCSKMVSLDADVQKDIVKYAISSIGLAESESIKAIQDIIEVLVNFSDKNISMCGKFFHHALSEYKDNKAIIDEYERIIRIGKRDKNNTIADMVKIMLKTLSSPESIISYLKMLKKNEFKINPKLFYDIKFPTQSGELQELRQLCNYKIYKNAQKQYLLNEKVDISIFDEVTITCDSILNDTLSVDELDELWPSVNVGLKAMLLFVSMQESYRQAAFLMMNQPQNNVYFTKYLARDYQPTLRGGYEVSRFNCDVDEAFKLGGCQKNYVRILLSDSNSIEAVTITGEKTKIGIDSLKTKDKAFSLIKAERNGNRGNYIINVHLLPLKDQPSNDANAYVIDLINEILNLLFERQSKGADEINYKDAIKKIIDSDQANIDATRVSIEGNIVHLLEIIKIDKNGEGGILAKKIDIIRELDMSNADLRASKTANNTDYEKNIDRICKEKAEIINLITSNKEISLYILKKIRNYLSNVQYDCKNIPFELFQNADDAVMQKGFSHDGEAPYFDIKYDKNAKTMICKHNGRNINEFDGVHYEWRRDLVNMLSFVSAKNSSNNAKETGKFGYGFKSCYFITDEPQIYSGMNISTRIVGGIIPEYLQNKLGSRKNETTFCLPLNDDGVKNIDELISTFKAQVVGLLLFSLAIKIIRIEDKVFLIEREKVEDKIWYNTINSESYLMIKSKNVDIVFKTNGKVIIGCREEVARYWTTTPLRNTSGARYMLNSLKFNIDMGRKQLGFDATGNIALIEEIGEVLFEIIIDLYEENLKLKCLSASSKEVATSIVKVLAESTEDECQKVLFKFVIQKLYDQNIVFTGSRFSPLESQSNILLLGSELKSKAKKITSIVNQSDINNIIVIEEPRFLPTEEKNSIKSQYEFIDKVIKCNKNELPPMFYNLYVNEFDCWEIERYIQSNNNNIRFKNKKGIYNTCLIHFEDDYALLAGDDRILSNEYMCEANDFMQLSNEDKAKLIISVKEEMRVEALDIGSKDLNVLKIVSSEVGEEAAWCHEEKYWGKIDEDAKKLLSHDPVINALNNELPDFYCDHDLVDVKEWWDGVQNKDDLIKKHRKHKFGSEFLNLSRESDDWIKLLIIVVLQGKGRAIDQANIKFANILVRTFIKAKKHPLDYPKEWIEKIILEDMLNGTEYEDWRRFLPYIGQAMQASEFLFDGLTESLNENQINNYKELLDFRARSSANGSDLIIPNLKQCLGNFYPIIIRELLHSDYGDKLSNECKNDLKKESFYSNARIKRVFGDEYDTQTLYDEAIGLGFDSDYPIHIYAYENCPEDVLDNADDFEYDDLLDDY